MARLKVPNFSKDYRSYFGSDILLNIGTIPLTVIIYIPASYRILFVSMIDSKRCCEERHELPEGQRFRVDKALQLTSTIVVVTFESL